MSEILSGARYTLGALVVLTLWSIGMVQFAQWKMEYQSVEEIASDAALLRFGPGVNASEAKVERYFDMLIEEKMKE